MAFVAMAVMLLSIVPPAIAAPNFPSLTGRIVDEASLLSAEQKQALAGALAALEEKSSDQLVVVTVRSLQGIEIEEYGLQLGRAWGIGQGGKTGDIKKDNGVLLIVAPNERKVRIEVGRKLEAVLTDTQTKLIIENRILPAFRRGDFAGGIIIGAKDITDTLLGDADAVRDRAKGFRRPQNSGDEMDTMSELFILLWIGVFLYIFYQSTKQANRMPPGAKRRAGDRRWIIIPAPGGSGGSGQWGGGWSGGGGGDSGGFSGGGGDFGGGGASGSW